MSATQRSVSSLDMTYVDPSRNDFIGKGMSERPSTGTFSSKCRTGPMVVKVPSKYTNAIQRRQEGNQNRWQGEIKYNNGGTVVNIPRRVTQVPISNWTTPPEFKPEAKGGFLPILSAHSTPPQSASSTRTSKPVGVVRPLGSARDYESELKKKTGSVHSTPRKFLYPEKDVNIPPNISCVEFKNGVLSTSAVSAACEFSPLENAISMFNQLQSKEDPLVATVGENGTSGEVLSLKASDYKKVLSKSSKEVETVKSKSVSKTPQKTVPKYRTRYNYLTINAAENSWASNYYNKYNVDGKKVASRSEKSSVQNADNSQANDISFTRPSYEPSLRSSHDHSLRTIIRRKNSSEKHTCDDKFVIENESSGNKSSENASNEKTEKLHEEKPEMSSGSESPGETSDSAKLSHPSSVSQETGTPPEDSIKLRDCETGSNGSDSASAVSGEAANSPPARTVRRSVRFSMESNRVKEYSPWEPIEWR